MSKVGALLPDVAAWEDHVDPHFSNLFPKKLIRITPSEKNGRSVSFDEKYNIKKHMGFGT